jgi:hypothetical protein
MSIYHPTRRDQIRKKMDAADVTPAFRAEFGLPIASCKQAGLTTLALSSANWLFSALPGNAPAHDSRPLTDALLHGRNFSGGAAPDGSAQIAVPER